MNNDTDLEEGTYCTSKFFLCASFWNERSVGNSRTMFRPSSKMRLPQYEQLTLQGNSRSRDWELEL